MVRSFFGPIDSLDASETKLFAILIGCRELLQMARYGAILEGDSFSVIQWCSGSSSYFGDWQIGWRRCKISQGDWEPLSIIFSGELMLWRIVLLVKEFLALPCLLMFSYLFLFV
eukprot:TRINITY_DN14354_c2_g1_i4.p1 TRINITY_DN14354_c2_g1~~TRINITY_DN14354_c2_g1_i4.p1  ORF type:complete len:114 (-),score=18.31 TRINITY_DN14354_c2_g1_i4:700-1041(-)